ncbi:MAG: MFS transporter, partial [Novosphingobium sp.]|nr:MFS transporter [Novosphingobium sp.]
MTLPADEPRSPLDILDYRRFWLARFLSVFATTGMVVVLGYQLYDVARSQYGMSIGMAAFQLGLLGLAQFLPVLLLTPVAGLIADRYDRRRVAGLAVGIDMIVALVLAAATLAGHLNLPLLFGLGALHGTARVFIGPAMASIAPNIVPVRLMPRAVAINSMAWQTGSVGGPAIAGLLFAQVPALPYGISAVLLGLATLL